jgi:hypothetical protein
MAIQKPAAQSDVYTAILAIAALCVLATAVFVAVTSWIYFGNQMWTLGG